MRMSYDTTYVRGQRNTFGLTRKPKPGRTDWHRVFCAYFHFVGWDCLSLGVHCSVGLPNLELHVPFGFFRIGWCMTPPHKDTDYAAHV